MNRCSLRQHDLDQVIRVERGPLLSVPQRGTPRSIVEMVITPMRLVCQYKNPLWTAAFAGLVLFVQKFNC